MAQMVFEHQSTGQLALALCLREGLLSETHGAGPLGRGCLCLRLPQGHAGVTLPLQRAQSKLNQRDSS